MVLFSLIAAALLIGIDQVIKIWVQDHLQGASAPIPFLHFGNTEVINLTYYENTGAAFSILEGKMVFLIIVTGIFLLIGLYLLIAKKITRPVYIISISLMIAGGVGNLIDRIFRGYVIDYLEVRLFRFAIFNFADCCVVMGALLLLISVIFFERSGEEHSGKERIKKKGQADSAEVEAKDGTP